MGHHAKLLPYITMLHKMAKPNETDRWAAESESEPKHLWTIAAGPEAKNFYFYVMEPKPEPEVCVPVTQPKSGASEIIYCESSVVCRMCT